MTSDCLESSAESVQNLDLEQCLRKTQRKRDRIRRAYSREPNSAHATKTSRTEAEAENSQQTRSARNTGRIKVDLLSMEPLVADSQPSNVQSEAEVASGLEVEHARDLSASTEALFADLQKSDARDGTRSTRTSTTTQAPSFFDPETASVTTDGSDGPETGHFRIPQGLPHVSPGVVVASVLSLKEEAGGCCKEVRLARFGDATEPTRTNASQAPPSWAPTLDSELVDAPHSVSPSRFDAPNPQGQRTPSQSHLSDSGEFQLQSLDTPKLSGLMSREGYRGAGGLEVQPMCDLRDKLRSRVATHAAQADSTQQSRACNAEKVSSVEDVDALTRSSSASPSAQIAFLPDTPDPPPMSPLAGVDACASVSIGAHALSSASAAVALGASPHKTPRHIANNSPLDPSTGSPALKCSGPFSWKPDGSSGSLRFATAMATPVSAGIAEAPMHVQLDVGATASPSLPEQVNFDDVTEKECKSLEGRESKASLSRCLCRFLYCWPRSKKPRSFTTPATATQATE